MFVEVPFCVNVCKYAFYKLTKDHNSQSQHVIQLHVYVFYKNGDDVGILTGILLCGMTIHSRYIKLCPFVYALYSSICTSVCV